MAIINFKKLYSGLYQKALSHKQGTGWALGIIVAALMVTLYHFNAFERLELLTLDARFTLRYIMPKSADNIVFIDMAEDSISAIGRWPWQRKWHAAIVKSLSDYAPKAIAFDVIFSEPQDEMDDIALSEAIRQAGVVYMPAIYDLEFKKAGSFYDGTGVAAMHEPIPLFTSRLKGIGHINAIPDSDGTLRRLPPVISYKGANTYQLGMKIGMDILGIRDEDVKFYPKMHFMRMKKPDGKFIRVPLDEENQLIINWLEKWGKEFPHYSYIDVIRSYAMITQGKKPVVDLNVFRGKICIIGLTATGLIDIKPIPLEPAYPAVGTNAMIANSVLTNQFIRQAPRAADIFVIIFACILVTLFLCNLRLLGGILLTIVGVICYYLFSAALFNRFNIAIVTFYPMLGILISYATSASYTQILQTIERARLFTQATRDGLTQLYNIRHFNLLLEAEFKNVALYKMRNLSIMMGDIDNFKHANDTYGHQAGDVILREVARAIQSKCRQTDVVGRYGGEEFIVMFFGASAKDASDVAEKIRAAVEARKFKFGSEVYSTTISLGVVQYSNEKNKDELVSRADSALYRAKGEGKNKVLIYSENKS